MSKSIKLTDFLKILFQSLKYKDVRYNYFMVIFDWLYKNFVEVFGVQITALIITAIQNKNEHLIRFYIIIFGISCVIYYFSHFFADICRWRFMLNLEYRLTDKYLREFILLDNNYVETFWTGRMQNIIFQWTNARYTMLVKNLSVILQSIWIIIYMLVLVFINLPLYQFFCFIWLFISICLFIFKWLSVLKYTRKKSKELQVERDRRKTKILMSKMEILQNNKFDKEVSDIKKNFDESRILWDKWNAKKLRIQLWWNILFDITKILIFIFSGIWVIYGMSTIAQFTLYVWILWLLSKAVWSIREQSRESLKSITDIEKLIETFEDTPRIQWYDKWKDFNYKKWDIQIKKLWFSYNEKNIVFKDFDLKIEWGKKTSFVWPSGWGKTTLIKLLAGYIRPDAWEIIVDNQKISELKLQSYYSHIWYLTQEPSVFDGTIFENLVYWLKNNIIWEKRKNDATEWNEEVQQSWKKGEKGSWNDKITEVVKHANCQFIYDFKDWLQTEIGERWIRLSGWQKQRLAIAKIMLKDPKIIFLDEPTSAMDSFNEEEVTKALHNLFKWRTVVVVAHRLQTVKSADIIHYIENWKIIESGTHHELIKLNGKYKRMLDLQSWF